VAAAFSERERVAGQRILIYDWGAGTFDAAVVEQVGDGFTILGHAGLPHCGGLDIDQIIYRQLCSLATEPSQRAVLDGTDDSLRARGRRLKVQDECRQKKELLSKRAIVRGDSLVLDPPLTYELTRDWLETAVEGLLHETTACCEDLLQTCGLSPGDLDHVLLVGGSSHAPAVRRVVQAELGCQARLAAIPETAVADGAAYWAWNTWQRAGSPFEPVPGTMHPITPEDVARPEGELTSGPREGLAFDVVLTAVGANKSEVVKTVQELTGLALSEAEDLVDSAPERLLEKTGQDDASMARERLEHAGATVELRDYRPETSRVRERSVPPDEGGARPHVEPSSALPEHATFDVVLAATGTRTIEVIKAVRELTSLGLGDAKDLVDSAPERVLENVARQVALAAKGKLERAGATVELHETRHPRATSVLVRPAQGGSAAGPRSETPHVAPRLTPPARTFGDSGLGEPRTLADGIGSPANVAVVGQSCWILRESPRQAVAELLRVDLPTGEVLDRLSTPGAVGLAVSPGGLVLNGGDALQVYDASLKQVREWKCAPGAQIAHVEATRGCAWGLVEEHETSVYPRASKGVRFDAKLVRIDFAAGNSQEFELGPDTFWTAPTHYRGIQLMALDGCLGSQVVALRCEWALPWLSVEKTKKASFVSEEQTSDKVRTYDVNKYVASQVSPPDLRQLLQYGDRILLAFWRCTPSDCAARAAISKRRHEIGQADKTTVVYEVPGTQPGTFCHWLTTPVGPVLFAGPIVIPGSGEKTGITVERLASDQDVTVNCATLPGDVNCVTWEFAGTLRELRVPSAIRGQELWWGMADPSGIVCLDGENQITRFPMPGNPIVFAVDDTCAYVVAEGRLQAVPVPPSSRFEEDNNQTPSSGKLIVMSEGSLRDQGFELPRRM
jgi:ribosomal protein L7/L12